MKKQIEVFDYASTILKQIPAGVLLTTKFENRINTMTIGWGTLGMEWNRNIFIAFIRENRFSRSLLEQNPEFTINVALGGYDHNIISRCGIESGRNIDKIKELNLTLEEPQQISVPGIREFPLTLECKVLYKQMQEPAAIPETIRKVSYPQNVDSSFHGPNKDYHMAYYGEIVSAYIIT
ncbi:MAG: flavin reductase family protein [Lachnospiraceae bacterium]|nr:flavin reductase family protein [Lachnospiraceae bacterium]